MGTTGPPARDGDPVLGVHPALPGGRLPPADTRSVQGLMPGEVYRRFGTSPRGLPAAEAGARLERCGRNELPPARRRRVALRFLAQFTDLFAVVLEVASGIMFLAWLVQKPHDVGNLQLALAILAVVVLNATIGFFQEYSAERTAEALQALVPKVTRVIRQGERVDVPAAELVPGDVVVLEAGDAISADARVVEAHDLAVNMAALTGESQPRSRTGDPSATADPLESRNLVLMGTSVTGGSGKAVVTATGGATEFGRIYRLTAAVPEEKSPLQRQVAHMARRVAAAAIGIGVALFAVRSAAGSPLVESFVFALGVMVALVPEGLPATLSVSLAIGVRRMARRAALIKKLLAVEALGSTTVICTDKTGTLTTAEMTVQALWSSGRRHAVSGVGYEPTGTVEGAGEVRELLRAAVLCSDARLVRPDPARGLGWRILGDTTEGAIVVAAVKTGMDVDAEVRAAPRIAEFPFDPDRKLMTTVHQDHGGQASYVKGSPQQLLSRCSRAAWDGSVVEMTGKLRRRIEQANDAMAADALRVLAVATRPVRSARPEIQDAESDLTFLGLVAMLDPPRPEVADAVARCRGAGIRIIMVTGDYGLTAEGIGRRIGVITGRGAKTITGEDLEAMSELDLKAALQVHHEVLFARVRPEHKLRVVSALKDMGEVVAVTGDGVNDAPALKRADIGVAMGRTGTDVAREASVMILLDDSFASIVHAVELGRSVYQNIGKFLVYLFSHNIGELVPILVATFVGFPLVPLTALQVLAIDLGSDVMPALALGAEPPEPGAMDRPARPPAERLFSAVVVRRFLFLGAVQAIGVTAAFFWKIHTAHLPFSQFTSDNPTYREALTMTQAGIVVSQFFNGFAVRTEEQSVFRVGLLSNRPLVWAELAGIGIVAAISYLPPLQSVFNTAPLSLVDWLILVVMGAILLAASEARKAWLRRSRRRRVSAIPGRPARAAPEGG
ncbi:MAG: cation-translocating P-type ATPase [Micromonosporaceae bacterium]